MKQVLLGTVALVALNLSAPAAFAADMPLKAPAFAAPAANWTGAYLGIQAGYGWGDANYNNLGGSSTGGTFGGVTVPFSNNFGANGFQTSNRVNGGIVGEVSGMNWQTGQWVYGLEQTISWSPVKGSTGNINFPVPPATAVPTGSLSANLKWYTTAESRFGYAFGDSLLFVKGGFAAGRVEVDGLRTNGAGTGDHFSFKDDRIGWTGGAGWNYMLSRNWIIGVEGTYVSFGKSTVAGQSVDVNGGAGAGGFNEEVKFKFWNALATLSYKW